MKTKPQRVGLWSASAALLLIMGAGCGKAPVPPSENVGPGPDLTNSRIESVQNNPDMSPEEKQKAIAILKSREAGGAPASSAAP